jgi:Fe-S cluster biosynthesis and repair protein YggX
LGVDDLESERLGELAQLGQDASNSSSVTPGNCTAATTARFALGSASRVMRHEAYQPSAESAGLACSATFTRRAAAYPTRQVVGAGRARAHTRRMARTIKCIKLGREAQGLDFPPYPGQLGKRIFENVSKEAWQQWLEHQKMLVNENRLNLADKKARDYLAQQMENHFFGSGADVAAGYVPPTQQK